MEGDDLDNLIADSLGGIQSALEGEKKAGASGGAAGNGSSQEWAKEAVRDLQQGPSRSDGAADGQPPGEDFFNNLVKTFQDENFQKVMAEALQGGDAGSSGAAQPSPITITDKSSDSAVEKAAPTGESSSSAAAVAASGGSSSSAGASSETKKASNETGAEEFMNNFLKSFDTAIGKDPNFENSLSSLMTSMLSNDLICEPLAQIAEKLEPWLKAQKGLSSSDRNRYESQLKLYKHIIGIYKSSPDPLPEDTREQVQRLLTELHTFGQPPDEVLRQIAPKEAEEGGESFEDFMKAMGIDGNLGSAEQDLLKKLSEDPEELTKMMQGMAGGLPEEACKQQ